MGTEQNNWVIEETKEHMEKIIHEKDFELFLEFEVIEGGEQLGEKIKILKDLGTKVLSPCDQLCHRLVHPIPKKICQLLFC